MSSLRASQLYAVSQGEECRGKEECHYCGAPCVQGLIHTEPRHDIGARGTVPVKVRHSPYLCVGCWLFRRKRLTVCYLGGGYKDRQCPTEHSWFVTEKGAWAVRREDAEELYECLLDPPQKFVLALLDGEKVSNHLQLALANDNPEPRADTPQHFTVNNVPHSYTPYELTEGLRHGPEGREPGVRVLLALFGPYEGVVEPKVEAPIPEGMEKRPVGRPPNPNKGEFVEPKERAVKKLLRRAQ